jgi:very-short-patch-repair endonuclease/uncharacterized Zn finger protein (UPF0148 family)
MLKFKCENCRKIIWDNPNELTDGKTVCKNCYKYLSRVEIERELKQKEFEEIKRIEEIEKEKIEKEKQSIERNIKIDKLFNEIFEKEKYELILNFVKKYPGNNDKKFDTLIKLFEVKYNIKVDRDIFKNIIWRIQEIYDERIELEKLERELLGDKKDNSTLKNLDEGFYCVICKKEIDEKMFYYSKYFFDKSLCLKHQGTKTQKELFIALKNRDLDCEYELWNENKHIDIAIHDAKLFIEIDGNHHLTKQKQFINDLKRDKISMSDTYLTRCIGNVDIEENLEDIANVIARYVSDKK